MDLRVERGAREQFSEGRLVLVVRERSGLFDILETMPPLPQHLLGIVEPLRDVAAKCLAKELGESLPETRVEELCFNRDFAVEVRRVGRAVTPSW